MTRRAFGAGLGGDQGHAQDLVRGALHLIRGGRDLDAAAFAPAAGMDLGLDHKGALPSSSATWRASRLVSATAPSGTGTLNFFEQFFALILVNLHRSSFQKRYIDQD